MDSRTTNTLMDNPKLSTVCRSQEDNNLDRIVCILLAVSSVTSPVYRSTWRQDIAYLPLFYPYTSQHKKRRTP